MNQQSFITLEFDKLCSLIQRGAQTEMGRAALDALKPHDDLNALSQALQRVAETVELRKRGVRWSFEGLDDPNDALARLHIAGVALDALAILALARWCEHALAARAS